MASAAVVRLAFAEDFVESAHLGEKQVAGRAADLSIRASVIGPGKPGDELVGLNAEVLQPQHIFEGPFLPRRDLAAQFDEMRLLSGNRIG